MPSTILCIDDRLHMLALRKAKLETRGYSVTIASSGHAGMMVLKQKPVDTICTASSQEDREPEDGISGDGRS